MLKKSVGNLCTLVLVAIADAILHPDHHLSSQVGIGCLLITLGFGILVVDVIKTL